MAFNGTTSNNSSNVDFSKMDRVVGSMLICTSLLGIIAYIPVLWAMLTSKLLKASCYKFMISLSISDTLCLIGWTVIGIHTVTHGRAIPEWMITVVLCICVVGWGSLCSHLVMIAVNMYVNVCCPTKLTYVFSKTNVKSFLCCCWIYAIFIHGSPTLFVWPHMIYDIQSYTCKWVNKHVTQYYVIEDITFVTLISIIFVACYVGIMMKYAQVRRKVAQSVGVVVDTVNPPSSATNRRNSLNPLSSSTNRRQFKLALQTAIRFATFFIYDILYYVISECEHCHMCTKFLLATYLWCLNNALSPFIYLCFNGQLQFAIRSALTRRNILIKSSSPFNDGRIERQQNVWTLTDNR